MKPTISLCMIVKNEAGQLPRCLSSVKQAVDEIIIVDTGSTDGTKEIAKSFGAQLVSILWNDDFAFARNVGLLQAKGSWILFLDADEELDERYVRELRLCSEHTEYDGFFLQVHNHQGEVRVSPVAAINPILRMFRNRPDYRFSGKIHEQIAQSIVDAKPGAKFHLTNVVVHHYGYSERMMRAKEKVSRNMTMLQDAVRQRPEDPFQHYNLAVEYMRLQQYEEALKHLRNSIANSPKEISYRHLLYKYEVRCLISLLRYQEAAEACAKGLGEFPDYTDLVHLSGVIYLTAGRKPEALEALIGAVRMGPAPGLYHTEPGMGGYLTCFALGQLFEAWDDEAAAIHWYSEAVKQRAPMLAPLQRIVRLFASGGSSNEVPVFLRSKFQMSSPEAEVQVLRLLMEEDCYTAALAWMSGLERARGDREAELLRHVKESRLQCTAWTGSIAEAERRLQELEGVEAGRQCRMLACLRWLKDLPGSEPWEEAMKPDAGEAEAKQAEWEFAVKAAFFSGHKPKAFRLLSLWLAKVFLTSTSKPDKVLETGAGANAANRNRSEAVGAEAEVLTTDDNLKAEARGIHGTGVQESCTDTGGTSSSSAGPQVVQKRVIPGNARGAIGTQSENSDGAKTDAGGKQAPPGLGAAELEACLISRTLLALARDRLDQADRSLSPSFSLYRKAKLALPGPRVR